MLHDPVEQLIRGQRVGKGLVREHQSVAKHIGRQIGHVLRQGIGASA